MKRTKSFTSVLSFDFSDVVGLQRSGIQVGEPRRVPSGTRIEMFGMFGDGNNANTFYPGLDKADFMPKPEDMVDIPFRVLSATIVGANSWKATDFTDENILKASMPMQNNQPIFFDHEQSIPNWLGLTVNPYWQVASSSMDGKPIPAGINATYRIDAKANPKIARGLVLGAIGSTSTTVKFDWKPSHIFKNSDGIENPSMFYDKIGTIDPTDGKMVRRIVTKIHAYHENSLVWLGADPMAKRLDDAGNIVMPDFSSMHYSADKPLLFSAVDEKEKKAYTDEKKFTISYTIDNNIISLSKQTQNKVTLNKTLPMKKFLQAFLAAFGTKLSLNITLADDQLELTADQETSLVAALAKLILTPPAETVTLQKKQIDFLAALKLVNDKGELVAFDLNTATGEFSIIAASEVTRVYAEAKKVTTLQPLATIGKEHLDFKRAEAIRFYKITVGDAVDEAVVSLMEGADNKALDGLIKLHTKGATSKFTATCTKCNTSDHVEMRSSMSAKVDDPTPAIRPKSVQEMAAGLGQGSMFIGRGIVEDKK